MQEQITHVVCFRATDDERLGNLLQHGGGKQGSIDGSGPRSRLGIDDDVGQGRELWVCPSLAKTHLKSCNFSPVATYYTYW